MIDRNLVPQAVRDIVETYLSAALPRADYDHLILMVLYGFSKIACCNRVVLKDGPLNIPEISPNFYMLSFSESGSGKDLGMRILNDLLDDFHTEAKRRFAKHFETETDKVEKQIELKKLKGAAASSYRDAHSPRFLKMEIDSNATIEGFICARVEFENCQYGCSCWEDSEIYDTIQSTQTKGKEFLKYNKEAYDTGRTKGKTIKGEKKPVDVDKVPHLVSLHGAIDGDEDTNLFKNFFDLGWGRRSFLYIAPDLGFKEITTEERHKLAETARNYLDSSIAEFNKFDLKTRQSAQIVPPRGCVTVLFSKNAQNACFEYENDCSREAYGIRDANSKGIKNELEGRSWKVIKLAGLIALLDSNPTKERVYTVELEHFEKAKGITNHYGEYFAKFYKMETDSIEKKMCDYIESNPGISRSDITKSKILGSGTYNAKIATVKSLIEGGGIEGYLSSKGKILLEERTGAKKNGKSYMIVEPPEHKTIDETKDIIIHYSQSATNGRTETTFSAKETPFKEFYKVVCEERCYSAARFKGDKRKAINWIGGEDLIILDIDNDVPLDMQFTIAMAHERFGDYTHLIVPTKSHNVKKAMNHTGKTKEERPVEARERFRLIIPTLPMTGVSKGDYRAIMERLLKTFNIGFNEGGYSWVDVPALSDPSRMYFGHNAKPEYHSGKLINWEVFKYELIFESKDEYKTQFKNQFDNKNSLSVGGRVMDFREYLQEALRGNGETVPCNAYCHEDKNASAFLSINNYGDFQYNCSACGKVEFYKL